MRRPLTALCLILGLCGLHPAVAAGWKAGAAKVAITPKQPMWMAGYASRDQPSEGAVHDLWAKALALQGPDGRTAVLVTLDVCGIGRDLSVPIRDELGARHGLKRDRIVLACSHTHSGPVVGVNLLSMYRIDDEQRRLIKEYAKFLVQAVEGVVREAFERLEPAELAFESGRCDFAVNRRENKEPEVPELRARLALRGPVDHDAPVLRTIGADGKARAIVFGYACHCTVLSGNQFCGDYAGFAQIALEKANPGALALFVAGCGGDQNPVPRRTVELAEHYGNQLAASVQRVLDRPMRPIAAPFASAATEVDLPFAPLPSRDQIARNAESPDFFVAGRAKALLKTIEAQGALSPTYPYPIVAWRLGDLTWFFLGGEVVVDYSLRIKRNLGPSQTWVSAYCNDVCAYMPSLRVLKEGGYEGATSMLYYAHPTVWAETVEEDIINAVSALNQKINEHH